MQLNLKRSADTAVLARQDNSPKRAMTQPSNASQTSFFQQNSSLLVSSASNHAEPAAAHLGAEQVGLSALCEASLFMQTPPAASAADSSAAAAADVMPASRDAQAAPLPSEPPLVSRLKVFLHLTEEQLSAQGFIKKSSPFGIVFVRLVPEAHALPPKYVVIIPNVNVYEGEVLPTSFLAQGKGCVVNVAGELYIGEFKNGAWDGNGTFTFSLGHACKQYTGPFLKGKLNGVATLVWKDGAKHVGEFKNGSEDGEGTHTFSPGDLRKQYTGPYLKGKYHGVGTLEWKDGGIYVGEFKDGERSGEGAYTFPPGDACKQYTGSFLKGQFHGVGTMEGKAGTKYVGEFKDGVRSGEGNFTYAPSHVSKQYTGSFLKGQFHGVGTMEWKAGAKYVGEFKDGLQDGDGTHTYAPSHVFKQYTGPFLKGQFHGVGTLEWKDGGKYVGEFKVGERSGEGTITFPPRHAGKQYAGAFLKGQFHGVGALDWKEGGKKIVGQFKEGKIFGQATYTSARESYKGAWEDSKFHGEGFYTFAPGGPYRSYEGFVSAGLAHGIKGALVLHNKITLTASFLGGKPAGFGKVNFSDASAFEGDLSMLEGAKGFPELTSLLKDGIKLHGPF